MNASAYLSYWILKYDASCSPPLRTSFSRILKKSPHIWAKKECVLALPSLAEGVCMAPEKAGSRQGSTGKGGGTRSSAGGGKNRAPPGGTPPSKDVTPRKVPSNSALPAPAPGSARDGRPRSHRPSEGGAHTSLRPDSAAGAGTPGYIKQNAQTTTSLPSLPEVPSSSRGGTARPNSKRETSSRPVQAPPSDSASAPPPPPPPEVETSSEPMASKRGEQRQKSPGKSPRSSSPRSAKSGQHGSQSGLLGWFNGLSLRKSQEPNAAEAEAAATSAEAPADSGPDNNPLKLDVRSKGNRKSQVGASSPRGSDGDDEPRRASVREGETDDEQRLRIWATVRALGMES